jgi:2-oxoglutarate ferredoxin oxidoreductase subunit alpha
MRGGPGLGNILPSQADYFQVTKSAGHGDYHPIVLAPASVQEAIDFTVLAFELARKYRHLVILAADGQIGQMMEPAELPPMQPYPQPRPSWSVTGAKGRDKNVVTSLYMNADAEEVFNIRIQKKLSVIRAVEQRSDEFATEDAELLVVGYGTSGRIAMSAVQMAREKGLKVGLFRPQTLYPFPDRRLKELAEQVDMCLVIEMNAGQMVEDVRLAVNGVVPVEFYGRMGGNIPMPDELLHVIERYYAYSAVLA